MKISASILAADLSDAKNAILSLDTKLLNFIHIDVMDGHFVPQLSFGEAFTKDISKYSPFPLDVHLMVARPDVESLKYIECKPHFLTFHLEACPYPIRLIRLLKSHNIKVGIALNPSTSIGHLGPIIDEIDLVLLMSVEPGFYGQSFLETTWKRIQELRHLIHNRNIEISVDGGVNAKNLKQLQEAGVDNVIMGSAVFQTKEGLGPQENLENLHNILAL